VEHSPKGENFRLGTGTQTSYQRSWKKSRLEKRNIWEKSCLQTGTLTDSKGFCEISGLGNGISWKTSGFIRETYSRLSDIPAGDALSVKWTSFTFYRADAANATLYGP
jgi:hypothetical protein